MTKAIITKTEKTLYRYDLDGLTLPALATLFTELAQQYGDNATIDICDWGDGGVDFDIESHREETDAEYAARLTRTAQAAEQQEARERAQLKALQAKYGNAQA